MKGANGKTNKILKMATDQAYITKTIAQTAAVASKGSGTGNVGKERRWR